MYIIFIIHIRLHPTTMLIFPCNFFLDVYYLHIIIPLLYFFYIYCLLITINQYWQPSTHFMHILTTPVNPCSSASYFKMMSMILITSYFLNCTPLYLISYYLPRPFQFMFNNTLSNSSTVYYCIWAMIISYQQD